MEQIRAHFPQATSFQAFFTWHVATCLPAEHATSTICTRKQCRTKQSNSLERVMRPFARRRPANCHVSRRPPHTVTYITFFARNLRKDPVTYLAVWTTRSPARVVLACLCLIHLILTGSPHPTPHIACCHSLSACHLGRRNSLTTHPLLLEIPTARWWLAQECKCCGDTVVSNTDGNSGKDSH